MKKTVEIIVEVRKRYEIELGTDVYPSRISSAQGWQDMTVDDWLEYDREAAQADPHAFFEDPDVTITVDSETIVDEDEDEDDITIDDGTGNIRTVTVHDVLDEDRNML